MKQDKRANKKEKAMNHMNLDHSIEEIRKKLRERYKLLTEDHLSYTEGKAEEFILRIQRVLGKTRDEMEKILGTSGKGMKEEGDFTGNPI